MPTSSGSKLTTRRSDATVQTSGPRAEAAERGGLAAARAAQTSSPDDMSIMSVLSLSLRAICSISSSSFCLRMRSSSFWWASRVRLGKAWSPRICEERSIQEKDRNTHVKSKKTMIMVISARTRARARTMAAIVTITTNHLANFSALV